MKNKINSRNNIFTKLEINSKKKSSKIFTKSKYDLNYIPKLRKIKSFNNSNIINDLSYIPKQNILKILVKNQKNNNMREDNGKVVVPLRNKICAYQTKNEIINKEIKELRNETKTFISRYKMSGLLTPKNNSHYLKLGISDDIIKDIVSEGYKMTDVLNKTNIFDKSLLLNKHYANFTRNIIENKSPELINDNNYIIKMNESLNEKKNSDLFTHSNSPNNLNKVKRRVSVYNIDLFKQKIEEETKVSVVQLINEFNMINKDLKMITNRNIIKERQKRYLTQKEIIKNEIQKGKTSLIILKGHKKEKSENKNKNKIPTIKKSDNEKSLNKLNSMNISFQSSNNGETLSPKKTKTYIDKIKDIRISLPNLRFIKRKSMINNLISPISNNNSSKNSSIKSLRLSGYLSKENKNDELYKNKRRNFNKIEEIINRKRNVSQYNKKKLLKNLSMEELDSNPINKTEYGKINSKPEKRNPKIDEYYKKNKNHFLQRLYNNIKVKRFNENKNEISDYLRIYKGSSIKEPNYEKGSQIYNLINEFTKKTKEYNLPNEINKIRNKTNLFSYKNSKQFEEILKLNNKVHNLIYDYVEDILDLNNDIKK